MRAQNHNTTCVRCPTNPEAESAVEKESFAADVDRIRSAAEEQATAFSVRSGLKNELNNEYILRFLTDSLLGSR